MNSPTIYLAGPIDYNAGDPDERHADLMAATPGWLRIEVYCPFCEQTRHVMDPETRIATNNVQLSLCDWLVAVWDAPNEPSIGTPIELYQRAIAGRPSIVVGSLGSGMFAQWLAARSVRVVDSMRDAVSHIAGGS